MHLDEIETNNRKAAELIPKNREFISKSEYEGRFPQNMRVYNPIAGEEQMVSNPKVSEVKELMIKRGQLHLIEVKDGKIICEMKAVSIVNGLLQIESYEQKKTSNAAIYQATLYRT